MFLPKVRRVSDDIKSTVSAAGDLAKAVSGPDTPDAVQVVQRDDALKVWTRGLSGPAVSMMLVGIVLLLASWAPFIGDLKIWTSETESVRAQGVVVVACVLASLLGVVLWVAHVGKPSRTEFSAGPAHVTIEQGEAE